MKGGENAMDNRCLPVGFADLEPLVGEWSLAGEAAPATKRMTSDMAALKAFHAAAFPRLEAMIAHLDTLPNDPAALPDADRRLFDLALMVMEAAAPIDLEWPSGDIADAWPMDRFEFLPPSQS